MPIQPTLVSLNLLIVVIAFTISYVFYCKGKDYSEAALFTGLLGLASLFGAAYHYVIDNPASTHNAVIEFNRVLPQIFQIHIESLIIRLWYITVLLIGLTECTFFFILHPVLTGKLKIIEYYFIIMLCLYIVTTILFDHYVVVVCFHVFTQVMFMIITSYLALTYSNRALFGLTFIALFNILSGVTQQSMMRGYIPTGSIFNYNDWYHMLICIMLILVYLLFSQQKIIQFLYPRKGT